MVFGRLGSEEIDQRQATDVGDGFDLVRPEDCARLSLHGGSF
jgi:hypothetical protein